MNKYYLAITTLFIVPSLRATSAPATPKSALTAALEQRRLSPLPFMVAAADTENNTPSSSPSSLKPQSVRDQALDELRLVAPSLRDFFAKNAQPEDFQLIQEEEPSFSGVSSPLAIGSGHRSEMAERNEKFAVALSLAVQIQKRLSPKK